MVETTSVIAIIIGFVVAAIVLSIGVTILGATSTGFDCKKLSGYNSSGADDAAKYPSGTYAGLCFSNSTQIQSSYSILTIVTVVLAAAAILYVIRMF